MEYLLSLLFPVVSYFLQIYPRFFNKYFGVDVWTILIEADLVRKNGHKMPSGKRWKGFILEGNFDYPPLFLILMSFLSKKSLEKYQGFISPFFDALQNILIFFITMQLTGEFRIALGAQLIYTLTPISALENSALLARSLGYFLFSLSFYSSILYSSLTPHNTIYLFLGLLFCTLTILTHRFATQSLLFISIFFMFVDKTPIYLLIFFTSILLAIIVTNMYYIKVLKGHISNIYFWMQNYPNRFAHQVYGNVPSTKNPDLIGVLYKLLSKFAPFALLGSNVWVLSGFCLLLLDIPAQPILTKMTTWIIFFYILAVLVQMIKPLVPIGEGYRYIEMTLVPTSIISSYLFFHFFDSPMRNYAIIIAFFFLAANATIIIFLQKKAVINDKNRSLTENMKKIFRIINTIPGKPRIMCIPHQMTTMVVYNTKAEVLVGIDTCSVKFMKDFYPVLKKPIPEIAKKYQLTHLLLRESFAKSKDLKIKNVKITNRSGDIVLIDLKHANS